MKNTQIQTDMLIWAKGQGEGVAFMTARITAISPLAAKTIAVPTIANINAFLAFSICVGLPAEVRKRAPAQTNITIASAPIMLVK